MAEPVNYRIQAVPTRYRSIEFDSRLEARWAAFFDECGWQWSYHPADLHGWFPDFQLTVGGETLLVEVKPIRQPHGPTWARMVAATSWDAPLLLVGAEPLRMEWPFQHAWAVGWADTRPRYHWGDGSSPAGTPTFDSVQVGHCCGSYDRDCSQSPTLLFDEANVWCLCGCPKVVHDDEVERRWAAALNATKHRPRGRSSPRRRKARRAAATDWANNRTSGDGLAPGRGSAQRGQGSRFNDRKGPNGLPPCPASEHRWKLISPPGDGEPSSYVCVVCAAENAW